MAFITSTYKNILLKKKRLETQRKAFETKVYLRCYTARMNVHREQVTKMIESQRQEVINDRVYSDIKDLDDWKMIMEYHINAVWDSLSLIKPFQNNFCS